MNNPTCCGVEATWVDHGPSSKIRYFYCRECKKEVEDPDPLARSASMSGQEAGDYLDRVLRDSAGQPITLEELDKGSVFLTAKELNESYDAAWAMAHAVPPPRKYSRIYTIPAHGLTVDKLIQLLCKLPEDAVVHDWRKWADGDLFEIKCKSAEFESYSPGAPIPRESLE